jgi:hypothetical protein
MSGLSQLYSSRQHIVATQSIHFILKHPVHTVVYGKVCYEISKEILKIISHIFIFTDIPRYRAFSPVFFYSVCLYVVANMSFLSAMINILHGFKKDDGISEYVFSSFQIVLLVSCTGVPVLAWLDTPKCLQYLHKWEKFQVGNSEFLKFSVNSKSLNFCLVFSAELGTRFVKRYTLDMFFSS